MPKSRSSRSSRRIAPDRLGYWERSKRPLQILAFLLPLVLIYELSLTVLLRSERGVVTNKAHESLLNFFAAFGISVDGSLFLGGIVVILVLLLWHMLNRDPWKINTQDVGFMAVESLVVAIPLLLFGQLIRRAAAISISASIAQSAGLNRLGLGSEWALSVGAGLYEELMFRMLLIAVIHTLLVDVGKASDKLGSGIAVVVSAAAFTWYHPLMAPADAVFYFFAGLYFGAVYVVRGFGIVVGAHALYDIITFSLAPAPIMG